MFNVFDYGADPTGTLDSSAAFALAIEKAVRNGASQNRMGDIVVVPAGLFRLDKSLDLYGNVQLSGTSTGQANGGSRLLLGTGSGIVMHSSSSSPFGPFAGGASVTGIDFVGTAPTFKNWSPNSAFSVGDCIRDENDNTAYYECVSANSVEDAGTGGVSGKTRPSRATMPELSQPWSPNQRIDEGTVRRSLDGNRKWYFKCQKAGTGTTDSIEPSWKAVEGGITTENGSNIEWIATDAGTFFPEDGELVWRSRFHSGILMLTSGSVERCTFSSFANAGISIVAYSVGWPNANANSWHVAHCKMFGCGTGIHVQGTDANAGTCIGVTATDIGSEPTRPRRVVDGKLVSTGHGFLDISEFGNTYIGCVAETTRGRGYCTIDINHPKSQIQRCAFINCYSEENCFPGFLGRGSIVLGGAQFAGGPDHAFEQYQEGLFLDPIYGVSNLKIRSDPTKPDVPWGAIDVPGEDFHGFYTFTDSKQAQNYFGWSRGQIGYFPQGWAFATMPYVPVGYFGVAGSDASEGAHWRDFQGHWRGVDSSHEQYFLSVATDIDLDPRWVNRGFRSVGHRQEPSGGTLLQELATLVAW